MRSGIVELWSVGGVRQPRAAARVAMLAVAVALVGLVPAAAVGASAPAKPTGIHAVSVTSSGFTVTIDNHAGATKYRVYVSSDRSKLKVDTIDTATSFASSSPSIVVSGIPFRTVPYYYRVKVGNGTAPAYSDVYSVSLKPSAPTGLALTSSASGTWLTWDAGRSTGFQVVGGTDAALTQNRVVYTSRTDVHQFSPYPLTTRTTYYFKVRTQNGSTSSDWSPVVTGVAANSLGNLRVLTYNVLHSTADGIKEGDGIVGDWASQRSPGVASLIKAMDPDVIALQEAGGWVGPSTAKVRQVDELMGRLGSGYQLVRTEIPPTEPHYFRAASYVIIKKASVSAVGDGDHWRIDDICAAYAELVDKATGGHFLVVSAHLTAGNESVDAKRKSEMTTLVANATGEAGARGNLPIVYAGDFNSHPTATLPNDGVSVVAKANLLADTFTAAQTLTDATYNSANKYLRTPPATSDSVDHIYAGPGVAVLTYRVVLKLVNGKFSGVIPSDHNPLVATVAIPY